VAGRRHVGLRGAAGEPGHLRRPGRRRPAHPALRRAHGRQAVPARGGARRPPLRRVHDPVGRGEADRRPRAGRDGADAAGRGGAALRVPRLPVLPARGSVRARHRGVRGPHPPPGSRRRPRRHLHRDARRPAGRAGHPRPADVRHGHGQGRRGHHVLPLEPVCRAQRGGRRPRALRGVRDRVPRCAGRPRGGLAGHDDHAVHPRPATPRASGCPRPSSTLRRPPARRPGRPR